jgi:hypothetical protein
MRHGLILLGVCVLCVAGCQTHPLTDYRPLDQVGMWSSNIEQLKTLNTSDAEVAQLVLLKQAGVSDDTCVGLLKAAHTHLHIFNSAEATVSLARAGFTEPQVLEIAQADQIDVISGDAVTLKLIGLSDAAVQSLLQRHLQGQPTLASAQIGRLKNTGLSERQILERINNGMTDAQAESEIARREAVRNHSNTGFVRLHGRKPR